MVYSSHPVTLILGKGLLKRKKFNCCNLPPDVLTLSESPTGHVKRVLTTLSKGRMKLVKSKFVVSFLLQNQMGRAGGNL